MQFLGIERSAFQQFVLSMKSNINGQKVNPILLGENKAYDDGKC